MNKEKFRLCLLILLVVVAIYCMLINLFIYESKGSYEVLRINKITGSVGTITCNSDGWDKQYK